MFVVYAAFTLAVVTSSTAFLMAYFGRTLEQEILESSEHLLLQLQQSADALLAGTTTTPIAGFMMGHSSSYSINRFLLGLDGLETSLHMETYNELVQIAISHRYVESIYLYRTSDDTLISSREGLILNASAEDPRKSAFANYDLLRRAVAMQSTRTWISPVENSSYWPHKPVTSFIQAVPVFPVPGVASGYVIINVDMDAFSRSIGGGRELAGGRTFAIDPAGRVFVHSDPAALLIPFEDEAVLTDVIRTERGFEVRTISGQNTAILWTPSAVSDWVYVSYLPMDSLNRQVFRSRQVTLFFLGLVAILSLVGIEIISAYLYRFILRLSGSARRRLAQQGFDTEDPAFLDSVIERLSERAKEIDAVNDRNRILATHKLSMDLLFGNVGGIDEVRERGALVGLEFDQPRYAVVLAEPDSRYYRRLPFDQREYIRYRALEIADHHFAGRCRTLSATVPVDHVVLILNFDREAGLWSRIDDLLMNLRTEVGLDQNLVGSDVAESPTEVRRLYERAREWLGYRYMLGYGNTLLPETIRRIEEDSEAFPFDTLRQYEVLLRSRRYDKLKQEVSALADAISECRYSLPIVRNIVHEIANVVAWVSEEQGITVPELGKHRLLAEAREAPFVASYRDWLFQVIDVYGENCAARKAIDRDEFLERVTRYIRGHLDNELSLQSVADAFSISQSHLSRTFKNGVGVSFHDFVLAAKIERARNLLTRQPDLTVSQVGRSLGYHDLAYFAKIFKERSGMTPTEYRRRFAEYAPAAAWAPPPEGST